MIESCFARAVGSDVLNHTTHATAHSTVAVLIAVRRQLWRVHEHIALDFLPTRRDIGASIKGAGQLGGEGCDDDVQVLDEGSGQ